MKIKVLLAVSLLMALFSTTLAQDAGKIGLTFRAGGSSFIGIMYHPIQNVGVRPYVSFTYSTTENIDDDGEKGYRGYVTDRTGIGAGLSVQYYITQWNGLAAYTGAGGEYGASKDVSTFTE